MSHRPFCEVRSENSRRLGVPGEEFTERECQAAGAGSASTQRSGVGEHLGLGEKIIKHGMTNILGKSQVRIRDEAALLVAPESLPAPRPRQ